MERNEEMPEDELGRSETACNHYDLGDSDLIRNGFDIVFREYSKTIVSSYIRNKVQSCYDSNPPHFIDQSLNAEKSPCRNLSKYQIYENI